VYEEEKEEEIKIKMGIFLEQFPSFTAFMFMHVSAYAKEEKYTNKRA
jgi:hypothetical protein